MGLVFEVVAFQKLHGGVERGRLAVVGMVTVKPCAVIVSGVAVVFDGERKVPGELFTAQPEGAVFAHPRDVLGNRAKTFGPKQRAVIRAAVDVDLAHQPVADAVGKDFIFCRRRKQMCRVNLLPAGVQHLTNERTAIAMPHKHDAVACTAIPAHLGRDLIGPLALVHVAKKDVAKVLVAVRHDPIGHLAVHPRVHARSPVLCASWACHDAVDAVVESSIHARLAHRFPFTIQDTPFLLMPN